MYQKDEWDTESLLDKIRKKEYTKLKEKPTHTSIFDDDAVADSAVDYLYSKDNQSKTQSFLKNSGFPSLQDRDFNKQLYGISEEQRQLRDMLKSTTNSILNAKLPTETDRAFLHGLMGEKDGEDDYQKQISDATRAKDDLLSAFRGTPFESGLKPIAPAKDALPLKAAVPETKPVTDDKPDATKESAHITAFDANAEYERPSYSDSKTVASILKTNAYNDNKNTVAYSANHVKSQKEQNKAPLEGTWEKRGFWPWQRTYNVEPPKWEDYYYWNNSFYQERTNCYAYALNIRKNPITNENFAKGPSRRTDHVGLAVGDFSAGMIAGEHITKSTAVAYVKLDVEMLGWTMEKATVDTPVPQGKWKIAIAIDPGKDYHFYRQDSEGSWSHKPSTGKATQQDASGNIITNPETANRDMRSSNNGNYTVFCGFYIIGPR